MLTQSNEHRSLVGVALAEFTAGINGGLKTKSAECQTRLGQPDPSSEFQRTGLMGLGMNLVV